MTIGYGGKVTDNSETLRRIAEALERLGAHRAAIRRPCSASAYHWDGHALAAIASFAPLPESLIVGVDRQKGCDHRKTAVAMRRGMPRTMCCCGSARGMGKSALVKSVTGGLQAQGLPLALVETTADQLASLPHCSRCSTKADRRFILFIDDMAFEGDDAGPRRLRSMLEGGSEARPANVRLYVTSNRRNIVERRQDEEDAAVNARDVADDRLALADRFGLKLGFQYPDQPAFLEMVAAYAAHFGLEWDEADALAFAHQRGGRIIGTHSLALCGGTGGSVPEGPETQPPGHLKRFTARRSGTPCSPCRPRPRPPRPSVRSTTDTQPKSPRVAPNLAIASRRIYSISMKASWLAVRVPCSFLTTPINGTRIVVTCGLPTLSHQSSFAQLNGHSEPPYFTSCSFRSGMVIMKATGSPSISAIRIRSSKTMGFSFFPA
jgi:predicted AAA+ superfamily ATPase